jgi:hypothetical protein
VLPLLWQVILGEDSLDWASGLAGAAVDTLIRVDVKHLSRLEVRFVLTRMNAINRAHVYASRVLGPNAGFSNNVRHLKPKPPFKVSNSVQWSGFSQKPEKLSLI